MWQFWAILSAVFASATAILAKVGVRGIDSNLATAIRTGVVLLLAWGIVAAQGHLREVATLGARSWLFLTLSGLATGLSWLCYFRAIALGPVSMVAPIDKLSVPLTIIIAWLALGEPLTLQVGLGALLITAGAIVMVL